MTLVVATPEAPDNTQQAGEQGQIHRFLFEHLDIRGAFVSLDGAWQAMQAGRNYAEPVAELLGEMAAVTTLIAGQLKQPGRLTFQMRGKGPVKMMIVDCTEQLNMRGMARADEKVAPAPAAALLGVNPDKPEEGPQLALLLELPLAKEPYQSLVPVMGDSVASIFEHYLEQSEQLDSKLFLAVNGQRAACLFLQKMPGADLRDADGWPRLLQLAKTVSKDELLQLDVETLLRRLFAEEVDKEGLRLYPPRQIAYHCPMDWDKVRNLLVTIGQDEVFAILKEHGEVVLKDDICNHSYRFSAADVAALFGVSEEPRTLH